MNMTKLKISFQFVIYLCCLFCVEVFSKKDRIIGGENTSIRDFPSIVSFKVGHKHGCSGAIISKRHVLTAAHCVRYHNDPVNTMKVYGGSADYSGEGATGYNILRVDVHPGYTGRMSMTSFLRHDIGVVTLRESISFTENMKKVHLPLFDVYHGVRANITGWGAISYPNIEFSSVLQRLAVTVFSHNHCNRYINYRVYKEQLCTYERPEAGPCVGDSGAPLIKQGTVIGVASFVIPCATGVPDVFTNVYYYVDFIRSIMRNTIS